MTRADIITADVHMHSNFSHDSGSTPEEMVKGAVSKGLHTICFTDHFDKDDMEWGEESIFDPEAYFEVLRPLQEKYRGEIEIRIGVELGLQPHLGDYYRSFVRKYPFDFVIGSVHSIRSMDPAAGQLFTGRSDEEVYRLTFEEMLSDIRLFEDFDVLGHLDYVVRYGAGREAQYSYARYADIIDEILRELVQKGKGMELNMAGLKYGLPFAHPHQDVLKRFRELGGEIVTVGADGHCPEHIAYDFEKASDILKSCGFKFYAEFAKRRPVFKQLP